MTEKKLEYVEVDSPDRCQSNHKKGQCRYKKVPGSNHCPMHGGNKALESQAMKVRSAYQLAKWQNSVDGFAEDNEVKGLRDEIGITRLLLQETVARCKDGTDLMLYSTKIGDLVMKIERLVLSCDRLETKMGQVLDKSQLLDFSTQILEILTEQIDDPDVLDRISTELVSRLAESKGLVKDKADGN